MKEKSLSKVISFIIFVAASFIFAKYMFSYDDTSNYVGTYEVLEKEGYNTPAFNLVINEDGSVRANTDGKGETYGNWIKQEGGLWLDMDYDFEFVFGFGTPFLDLETNRLYVSKDAFNKKHPEKYLKVRKR